MEVMALSMFAASCLMLLTGYPVAFTLGGVSFLFGLLGLFTGHFDFAFLIALPQRIFGVMTNEVLVAVPLLYSWAQCLNAQNRRGTIRKYGPSVWYNARRFRYFGGYCRGVVAASTGIVGATVVTMGMLSLPTMLKRGYNPELAAGTISAAGTLGQIIPPSIVLILLGDVVANAYQKAQVEMGIFAPETVSVGELFAGALIPGLMLVGLYILYQIFWAIFKPESSPAVLDDDEAVSLVQIIKLTAANSANLRCIRSILVGVVPQPKPAVGAIGTILLAGEQIMKGSKRVRLAAWQFCFVRYGAKF